jgi:hypothetical protein
VTGSVPSDHTRQKYAIASLSLIGVARDGSVHNPGTRQFQQVNGNATESSMPVADSASRGFGAIQPGKEALFTVRAAGSPAVAQRSGRDEIRQAVASKCAQPTVVQWCKCVRARLHDRERETRTSFEGAERSGFTQRTSALLPALAPHGHRRRNEPRTRGPFAPVRVLEFELEHCSWLMVVVGAASKWVGGRDRRARPIAKEECASPLVSTSKFRVSIASTLPAETVGVVSSGFIGEARVVHGNPSYRK